MAMAFNVLRILRLFWPILLRFSNDSMYCVWMDGTMGPDRSEVGSRCGSSACATVFRGFATAKQHHRVQSIWRDIDLYISRRFVYDCLGADWGTATEGTTTYVVIGCSSFSCEKCNMAIFPRLVVC